MAATGHEGRAWLVTTLFLITTPPLPGMTGILLCAAGLPVCLTRAPKPILHPPPVSKSDVKPVPGVPGVCRKTKKKHLKKSRPRVTPKQNPRALRTQ